VRVNSGFCWEPIAEGWINSITYAFLAIPNFIVGYGKSTCIVAGAWKMRIT